MLTQPPLPDSLSRVVPLPPGSGDMLAHPRAPGRIPAQTAGGPSQVLAGAADGHAGSAVTPAPDAALRPAAFDDLLGVRSSKGRYYSEYRQSTQDLQRALLAVNAVSWVLADAVGDARYLVDSTLPVIARLLGARAVVLVSAHPALGGARVCVPSLHPREAEPPDDDLADDVVRQAERLIADCPPTGVLRLVAELGAVLLVAPLPRSGQADGYVVAAVPQSKRPDGTDLAILGTLTNQLAGAIESSRRLAASEASRLAADDALLAAAEQARALARRNQLLKQARHELVGAREGQVLAEERQRIARDLHDSVAQHVLSMGMQVEWCRAESQQREVAERLSEVKQLARSTVDSIRAAIFELSSGDDLQTHGLLAAVQRLADQHRIHGLTIDVRSSGRPCWPLPSQVDRALYMVVKEALFNTVVHAEADRACVELTYSPGEVRVQVSDNGQGRADVLLHCLEQARLASTDGYHRGLGNIQERIRQVHGRLTICDEPAGGVCLQVCVPLHEQSR